jgi:hypothetical protein
VIRRGRGEAEAAGRRLTPRLSRRAGQGDRFRFFGMVSEAAISSFDTKLTKKGKATKTSALSQALYPPRRASHRFARATFINIRIAFRYNSLASSRQNKYSFALIDKYFGLYGRSRV